MIIAGSIPACVFMSATTNTDELNLVTDNINIEVLDRNKGVFEAINESHDAPEEHTYKVFCEGETAVHCTCPAWEYQDGKCKHMRVVEQFTRYLDYCDYQVEKKREEEKERKQAMQEKRERLLSDEELTNREREALESALAGSEFSVSSDANDDDEQDDDDEELSAGAKAAKETAKAQMSKDEWRSMSSEARRRAVAFL